MKAFERSEGLDHGSEQGLMMNLDSSGSGISFRFNQSERSETLGEFAAARGNLRSPGRCREAETDLRRVGIVLCGASAFITIASVMWLALSIV